MTIDQAKNKLVSWCLAQVGNREGANNWNKYADGQMTAFLGWYAQNQPWCDTFCKAAFIECFGLQKAAEMLYEKVGQGSILCRQSAQYFKDNGAFYKRPEVGDQAFFYRNGEINHTGIVVEVKDLFFSCVEGNSGDKVAQHTYSIGAIDLAGFGRPNWAMVATDATETPAEPAEPPENNPVPILPHYHSYQYNVRLNLLKSGDSGPLVRMVQILLNAYGYDCDETAKMDEATVNAVVAFQTKNGLTADGEVGGQTYKKLFYL